MIATVHTNPTAPSVDAAIYLVVGTPTVEIQDRGVIVRYGFVTPDPARIMWWRVVPDGEEPVRDVEAEAYLRQIGDTGLRKHNYSDVREGVSMGVVNEDIDLCPCCLNKPRVVVEKRLDGDCWVECPNCGSQGPKRKLKDRQEAIRLWNMDHPDEL